MLALFIWVAIYALFNKKLDFCKFLWIDVFSFYLPLGADDQASLNKVQTLSDFILMNNELVIAVQLDSEILEKQGQTLPTNGIVQITFLDKLEMDSFLQLMLDLFVHILERFEGE